MFQLKKGLIPLLLLLIVFSMAACTGQTGQSSQGSQSNQPSVGNQDASTPALDKLRIGVIPSEDADNIETKMKPLEEYLAKKLGMEIEIFVASDYTAVVEAMRNGHIDVGHFGPFSYVLAAKEANAEAFVSKVAVDTGLATYQSYIITHKDSGIKTLADLKGKNFSFVDPGSTSGNLVPRNELLKNGIDPDKDFATSIYAGGHDASGLSVQNKKVDAGAISDNKYKAMMKENLLPDVVILHESEQIPSSPVAYKKDLDSGLKEKIKQAYLDMDVESPESLEVLGLDKYGEITDKDYDQIREIAKVLNLDLTTVE